MKFEVPGKVNDPYYREKVYEIVRQIPSGKVMAYGQIADILGQGYTARTVGYVMHASPDDVPWQRVINSKGGCSTAQITMPISLQQQLLEAEGIIFNQKGFCDLNTYRWSPKIENEAQPSLFED